MKSRFIVFAVVIVLLIQACAPGTGSDSPQSPAIPPADATAMPVAQTPEVIEVTVGPATGIDLSSLPSLTPASGGNEISSIPANGIVADDNGKTFAMKVGDSFLLNLGTDKFDWTVSVDNENALRMKMGVMVIQGAQGIYDALAPGTVTISATGDPLCRKAKPACGAPSILFTVIIKIE